MANDHQVLDWDDMSEEDRVRAMDLLKQLNEIFDSYREKDDPTPNDEEILPGQS